MEKIKLNDGTTFDIVSGSYEYVNIFLWVYFIYYMINGQKKKYPFPRTR